MQVMCSKSLCKAINCLTTTWDQPVLLYLQCVLHLINHSLDLKLIGVVFNGNPRNYIYIYMYV